MKRNVRALFVSSVVGLLLVVMFGAASAAEPSGEGIVIEGESQRPFANNDNPDLHPEIQSVDFEYRYDYEYREYEAIVTVEVALSGRWGRLVSGTAVFRDWMANMKRPATGYLRIDSLQPPEQCVAEAMAYLGQHLS